MRKQLTQEMLSSAESYTAGLRNSRSVVDSSRFIRLIYKQGKRRRRVPLFIEGGVPHEKPFFEAAVLDELKHLLARLSPESKRQWNWTQRKVWYIALSGWRWRRDGNLRRDVGSDASSPGWQRQVPRTISRIAGTCASDKSLIVSEKRDFTAERQHLEACMNLFAESGSEEMHEALAQLL